MPPRRRYAAIDAVIRQAELKAAKTPNAMSLLAEVVKQIGDDGGDPYLLIGVLVEGAIHTLHHHLPPERQAVTAKALVDLLVDRLRERGLL